jgi:hypothetical protein
LGLERDCRLSSAWKHVDEEDGTRLLSGTLLEPCPKIFMTENPLGSGVGYTNLYAHVRNNATDLRNPQENNSLLLAVVVETVIREILQLKLVKLLDIDARNKLDFVTDGC